MYFFYNVVVNFSIAYYFCAVIENNFFVTLDSSKFYSVNWHLIDCDNDYSLIHYSLIYFLNSFVIC